MDRRAVITGCGIISSIGNNCNEVLESLQKNSSGIVFVPEWAELGFKSCVGGTIKGIDIEDVRKKIGLKSRYMDLSGLYSFLASQEAIENSCLSLEELASERVGCIVGSGVSNTEPIYQAGAKLFSKSGKITPYGVTRSMTSSCSANLVNLYGIKGRSYSISSACATSLHNIGNACEMIWSGVFDLALAGGADEVSAIMTANFDGMRTALSNAFNDAPEKASRPYDKKRDGFVISGGSGIVIVEEYERAKKRNAPIYGEIIGYGASSDGHDIIQPHPQGDGAYRCIREALQVAKCNPEEIDYINTHGTGTPAGDIAECIAIEKTCGSYKVPISSTKALTGHGIGAAGVHELIYCLLMMKYNFITASVNIEELDPAFTEFNIIQKNTKTTLKKFLTNSFGFGGTNACLIVQLI
jgi:3-oxoacyl-[acyl-carrier-protein] synthase-1